MKKIFIEPVYIDLKTIKIDRLKQMLNSMLLSFINAEGIENVANSVHSFCKNDDKLPKNVLSLLSSIFYVKSIIEEIDRRMCGDFVKSLKNDKVYKLTKQFTFEQTKNKTQFLVWVDEKNISN